MTDLVPTPPTVTPRIIGIAQISAPQAPTLPPGKYYFAYARNLRIDQWPKFAISDLGPAIEVMASNSFNAVDMYNNPEIQGAGGQSFNTLYMTDKFPNGQGPVHWRAVNTIALIPPNDGTTGKVVTKLLTVALLSSQGVYDGPTLNDIVQSNNVITNTLHTEGHSTAATGTTQVDPVGIDIRPLYETGPIGGISWQTVGITFAVIVVLILLFLRWQNLI